MTNLSGFFHGAAFGREYARFRRREVWEAALSAAFRDPAAWTSTTKETPA